MRDDEKTIMKIRLKRKNKRAIVELLQALGLIGLMGFMAGAFWTIKSCMGLQP